MKRLAASAHCAPAGEGRIVTQEEWEVKRDQCWLCDLGPWVQKVSCTHNRQMRRETDTDRQARG